MKLIGKCPTVIMCTGKGRRGACSFLAWQGSLRTLYDHTVCHHLHRFNLHVMMSLAHGKVSESAARLVLAERLLKVGVSWLVETLWFHWTLLFQSISEYAKSNTSTDCKVADVVSICAFRIEPYNKMFGGNCIGSWGREAGNSLMGSWGREAGNSLMGRQLSIIKGVVYSLIHCGCMY